MTTDYASFNQVITSSPKNFIYIQYILPVGILDIFIQRKRCEDGELYLTVYYCETSPYCRGLSRNSLVSILLPDESAQQLRVQHIQRGGRQPVPPAS